MNCWEYMDCPKETRRNCPAYPRNGRDCWKMPSTMCAGGRYRLCSLAEKAAFCRICEFYKIHASKSVSTPPEPAAMEDASRPAMPE